MYKLFWIADSKVLDYTVLILQLVMYHQPNVMVLTKEVPPSHYFLIWDNYSSFASLAYSAKNTLQKYRKVPPPTSIEKRVCRQSYVGFEKN